MKDSSFSSDLYFFEAKIEFFLSISLKVKIDNFLNLWLRSRYHTMVYNLDYVAAFSTKGKEKERIAIIQLVMQTYLNWQTHRQEFQLVQWHDSVIMISCQ